MRFPIEVTIVALAALLLLTLTAHLFVRAGDFRAFWIVALMIGAQTNGFRLGPINPLDVCNLIAMSALLAHHLLRARDNDANSDILFPMVVLAGAALLALQVPTFLYQNPVRWIIGSLALLKVVLLAAIVVNLVRSWRLLRVAADALVAVALLSGIAAIGQFVLSFFFGINLTLMDDPEAAFKPTPLGMIMRASGFCITAQHLSSFLLFALPFLLWRLFAPVIASVPVSPDGCCSLSASACCSREFLQRGTSVRSSSPRRWSSCSRSCAGLAPASILRSPMR